MVIIDIFNKNIYHIKEYAINSQKNGYTIESWSLVN